MYRMSHTVEGWGHETRPRASGREGMLRSHEAKPFQEKAGLWKYRTLHRSRWVMVFSILCSIGLHAFVLLGFNARHAPPQYLSVADDPIIQLTMPDLHEDEIDPVESLGDEQPVENPSVAVPLLADLPSLVPIDSFVQPLDFTPALLNNLDSVRLSVVPVNAARNSGSAEKLGRIFSVEQLDRQPEPLFRPSPIYPPELRKDFPEATVVMGFIINTKGEVLAPHVISSPNRRFEEAAIRAIEKWKFRPGYKGGRPVNTRTQIAIYFHVIAEN